MPCSSSHASAALGESKALGRNRLTFFTSSLIEGQKRSLELLEQLRESMGAGPCRL